MNAIQRLEKQLADTKAKLAHAKSLQDAMENWLSACRQLGRDITHICIPMRPNYSVRYLSDGSSTSNMVTCVELPKEEVEEIRKLIVTKAFCAYKQAKAAYTRLK